MRSLKQVSSILFRVVISAVLLFLLFKFNHVTVADVLAIIRNADKSYLLAAFGMFAFTFVVGYYRWHMLLNAADIHVPWRRVVVSYAGGVFFSMFLPSTIGGDLSRSIDLSTHTQKPRQIVATVFLDRLSGFIGLVLVAVCALIFGWRHVREFPAVYFSISVITAILLMVMVVLFNGSVYEKINRSRRAQEPGRPQARFARIQSILKDVHHEIHIFRDRKGVVISNVACSILIQVIIPVTAFLVARALGSALGLNYFFLFIPVISAISMLPISIGGLGLRENMTVLLFAHAGMSQHMALSMSLLSFIFLALFSGIGGLIYVLGVRYRRIQRH